MPTAQQTPEPVCQSPQIPELGKFTFAIVYRGERREALAVRFQGVVYGYLNECVHMSKTLDCEDCRVFDASGRYLQCSAHGMCFNPATGECLSEYCAGTKLAALRLQERGGWVYLADPEAALAG